MGPRITSCFCEFSLCPHQSNAYIQGTPTHPARPPNGRQPSYSFPTVLLVPRFIFTHTHKHTHTHTHSHSDSGLANVIHVSTVCEKLWGSFFFVFFTRGWWINYVSPGKVQPSLLMMKSVKCAGGLRGHGADTESPLDAMVKL